MRQTGNEAYIEMVNACRVLMRNPEELLGKPRCRLVDNNKMDLSETGWGVTNSINVAQDRGQWRALVNTVMKLQIPKNVGEFLSS
jgi:hypothetical protein